MLFELLIVLYIELVVAVGQTGAMLILAGLAVLAFSLAHYVANAFTRTILGSGGGKIERREAKRLAEEMELKSLDDDALRGRIEEDSDDAVARVLLAERLRKAGDHQGCALQLEALLHIETEERSETVMMRYFHLADLYAGPLGRPDDARRILENLIHTYPESVESAMAKERIERLRTPSDSAVS